MRLTFNYFYIYFQRSWSTLLRAQGVEHVVGVVKTGVRDRLVARPRERRHHVGSDVAGPTHDQDP